MRVPAGSGVTLRMVSGGQTIARVNCLVAVMERASVTRTVKVDVPAVVGVPVSTPALERDNPAGREPAVNANV